MASECRRKRDEDDIAMKLILEETRSHGAAWQWFVKEREKNGIGGKGREIERGSVSFSLPPPCWKPSPSGLSLTRAWACKPREFNTLEISDVEGKMSRRRQQLQLRTFAFSFPSFIPHSLHFFLEVSYYRAYCLSFLLQSLNHWKWWTIALLQHSPSSNATCRKIF